MVARWGRRRVLIGAVAVVAVLVAGFAVVQLGSVRGATSGVVEAPSYPEVGTARDGAGADGASAPVPGLGAPVKVPSDQAPSAQVPIGGVQRSLVRTAQLTVEVPDAEASIRQVRTAVAAVGGYVTEEQSGTRGGLLVLRVPADALDRLIEDIAAGMKVTGRSSQVVDATEQVVDLDARVASQQASVARVRALLAQATSIGDIISIESELARREAELDSLIGRLAALRDQVALSTLTVNLRTPSDLIVDGDAQPVGFLGGLAAGWTGLQALGSGVGAVIGFLLPFVPVLAVLAAMGWVGRRVVRSRRTPATVGAGQGGPGSEGGS